MLIPCNSLTVIPKIRFNAKNLCLNLSTFLVPKYARLIEEIIPLVRSTTRLPLGRVVDYAIVPVRAENELELTTAELLEFRYIVLYAYGVPVDFFSAFDTFAIPRKQLAEMLDNGLKAAAAYKAGGHSTLLGFLNSLGGEEYIGPDYL